MVSFCVDCKHFNSDMGSIIVHCSHKASTNQLTTAYSTPCGNFDSIKKVYVPITNNEVKP